MRARPAARPAQNGTRQPPQRRRAAETVNVNVSCWSAPVFMDEGEAPGAMELRCGSHLLLSAVRGGCGEHALGGGVVDDGPGWGRDDDGDVLLQGAVAGRVIRGAVLPEAP